MSEKYFDKQDFGRNVRMQIIKTYIGDMVWQTMRDMDFEEIQKDAYDNFFKKVEKIVRSEKLDNDEKVEKLLRLIQRYEITLY